ncbi:hypothetical protein ABZT17_33195 [Streptomyces sp. NPDC005648]|uniref:hypothetical protein n=1 Tax=Streptomyces sp. NPDC005648 TaxID=3157044 RepID=UPI0033BEB963
MTTLAHTTDTRVRELADLFVRFLETNTAPDGLFTDDVFLDFTVPQWRLQAQGREEVVAARRRSHPFLGTVPRHRVDATATGLVLEFEESWEDEQGTWYCRELMRAEIRDGAISEASVYCTGDWDPATQAAHAREVTLLRP